MPPLQVKDCPVGVYERLRQCAKEENRSIAQQALTIIEDYLDLRDQGAAIAATRRSQLRLSSITARDETDYAERHRRVIAQLDELPPIPVSEKSPSTVEILAQIRAEEAR